MRQNMVFSTKINEKFSGEGHIAPSPDPSPIGEGDTPSPRFTTSAPAASRPLPF